MWRGEKGEKWKRSREEGRERKDEFKGTGGDVRGKGKG